MYGNYRNFHLDQANRRAAQVEQAKAMDAQHQLAQQANRIAAGWAGSHGDPRATHGNMMHNIAQATTPYRTAMGQHDMNMRHAMQNAMNNEMAQVQDRSADMQENKIAAKRERDNMEYQAELNRQKTLQNIMGGLNSSFESSQIDPPENINAEIPEVNIYSNGGKRIGGSSIGKSLLS